MHIVTTLDSTINFIPRDLSQVGNVTVTITDEATNTSTSVVTAATLNTNFFAITPVYTFIEGGTYTFKVVGTSELYRGKIFCTDQSNLEKFTVNQGEYTQYDSDNNGYIYR